MSNARSGKTAVSPAEARRLLLLRALEETDAAGERIPLETRMEAGRAAAEASGAAFLAKRAEFLLSRLPRESAARRALETAPEEEIPRWQRVAPWVALAGALVLGWFSHELGEDRRLNLLAFPLLGLMLWNLAVCLVAIATELRKKSAAATPGPLAALPLKKPDPNAPPADPWVERAEERALREWLTLRRPALKAKSKWVFHAGAILLAAGMVAGMYVKGLGRDYRAAWESTFLEQPAVSRLLRVALGPASLATGIPVPEVPRENEPVPAASWIHLWAASAGLFIFIPRAVLLASALMAERRSGPDWNKVFADYEAAARSLSGGQPLVARVVSLQCQPDSKLRDSLRAVLQHLWGGRVIVDFNPPVAYGDEDEFLENFGGLPTHLVVMMPFSATPEHEVQGQFIKDLSALAQRSGRPVRGLVALETTAFEARLKDLPEFPRRVAERLAAWRKVLGDAFPILLLDEAARRRPDEAAAAVSAARDPLGAASAA